jgi:hypothetical protein
MIGPARVSQLSSLTMRHVDRGCVPPAWSSFVKATTGEADPVFSPTDLGSAEGIQITHDIAGLADRIAQAVRAKNPELHVGTVQTLLASGNPAYLDFSFACRCKQRGAPDGFYVTEVMVYEPAIESRAWREPARVLFYWNDAGDPAWKHLAKSCFQEREHSRSCLAAFQAADISFTDVLSAALGQRDRR